MKRIKTILFCASALAVGWLITPTSKAERLAQPRAALILQGTQLFLRDANGYSYPGIVLYCSSSSASAPTFPSLAFGSTNQTTISLAEAIATGLEAGLHVEHFDAPGLTVLMTR